MRRLLVVLLFVLFPALGGSARAGVPFPPCHAGTRHLRSGAVTTTCHAHATVRALGRTFHLNGTCQIGETYWAATFGSLLPVYDKPYKGIWLELLVGKYHKRTYPASKPASHDGTYRDPAYEPEIDFDYVPHAVAHYKGRFITLGPNVAITLKHRRHAATFRGTLTTLAAKPHGPLRGSVQC
jgi:hypothetical protein